MSTEQAAFWGAIREELELVGEVLDADKHKLRTGNIPCGLYFWPDGTWASETAYYVLANDVLPARLSWSVIDLP